MVTSTRFASSGNCFGVLMDCLSTDIAWRRADGHFIDPFGPRIQAGDFAMIDELVAEREAHLAVVRRVFEECDVFIFTLGLTEGWVARGDGAVFPLAPGTVASEGDTDAYAFHDFTVAEMEADLARFIKGLRSVNPNCRVLLTVSPVALIATYEDVHVLSATIYGKLALRVVAETTRRGFPLVSYFPSYEMITGPQTRSVFFEDDLREVRPEGVAVFNSRDIILPTDRLETALAALNKAADKVPALPDRVGPHQVASFKAEPLEFDQLLTPPRSEYEMNSKDFRIGLDCGVPNGISSDVLEQGLKLGIRYFDTSTFYPVGAIHNFDATLEKLNINRGILHLSLKLWITELGVNRSNDYDLSHVSLWSIYENWRKRFNVGRFDSVVVHWPLKVDSEGYPDEFRIEEIWPQLEQLVDLGCISYIGVSNFNIVDMHRVLNIARIKPFLAQVEFNPFAHSSEILKFCLQNGVKVVGHSPFNFGWVNGQENLFSDDVVRQISEKHSRPPSQVALSWMLRRGVIPIPGTTNPAQVQDYVDALTFDALSTEELQAIDNLNRREFHYQSIFDYFGAKFHRKYHGDVSDIHALVYRSAASFERISILEPDFLPKIKEGLTDGAGFVILPSFLQNAAEALQANIRGVASASPSRWAGGGPTINNILNSGGEVLEIVDDPLLSLIVESLLGWDCKLDNISLSTSQVAPNNSIFGPHQDSPFDDNPGAPLPPPSYPLVLQCIVALDEFTDENGPLYVIPYSHKKQLRVNLPWQGNLPSGKIPEGAFKAIVPKGSVIIAVGHIWHGTFPNLSSTPRTGMLIEFVCSICDAMDKFTVSSIKPELLSSCSRRVVRLLNNGKLHQHDMPSLLQAYKDARKDAIPAFARRE
jgi:diketogulonate reductase-like aldo/keto reductase